MILSYGAYDHADGECDIGIVRTPWRDGSGRYRGRVETWTIHGRMFASGADLVADLTTKIGLLETAYGTDGSSLILYESDGFTETAHKLNDGTSAGGVRVISGPSFPSGAGPEYATHRDYTITVEAKYQTASETTVEFEESITSVGTGGSRFVIHTALTGPPVRQTVADYTPSTLVQEGRAVGRSGYPSVPAPASSSDEHVDRRRISRNSPKRLADGTYEDYEVSWHYEFEKTTAFSLAAGTPHAWG